MRSRKASPLNRAKAVGAILDEPQSSPENPHLYPGFREIPLKISRIVEVAGFQYRSEALLYSLTVAVYTSRKLGPPSCPRPHSLTLKSVCPLQSLTYR